MTYSYKKVFLFLILALMIGCSTTPEVHRVATQKATELEFREFHEAELAYKNHKPTALKKLTTFIQKHPHTDLTDRAAYYAGQLYYEQADYFRASKFWLYITDSLIISDFYDKALVGAATSFYQMSRFDEALSTIGRFKVVEKTDRAVASTAFDLSAKLKLQKGNALGALQDTVTASEYKNQNSDKTALLNRASEIVTGSLTQNQLEQAISMPELQRFELLMRFRLGQLLYDQKSFGSAKDQFMVVITKYPDTEQARSAQGYLNGLEAQERTDSTVIGVILPLTGKYSQMGYKTLRGIQMGLGIFSKSSGSPLKLAIIDSEGNADIARRGVEKLVSEDHAVIIIGDILSKTATAVATKAQELGVPCLALAQKQDLSEIGDFIFVTL